MIVLYLLLISIVFVSLIIFLVFFKKFPIFYQVKTVSSKNNLRTERQMRFDLVIRILCLLYLITFLIRIINVDEFNKVIDLDRLFSPKTGAIITIIRTLTGGAVICYLIVSFFDYRLLRNIVAFFGTIIYIINIILFKQNIQAMMGIIRVPTFHYREIIFSIECILGISIGFNYLAKKFIEKDFSNILKQIASALLVLTAISLLSMNAATIQNIFGYEWAEAATDFSVTHLLVILGMIVLTFVTIFVLRKINKDDISQTVLIISSLACFSLYYSRRDVLAFDLSGLPLHLCNTAVILMVISFTIKNKPIFYFNYLVNVTGALFAIFLPDYSGKIVSEAGMHYWVNHVLLFILPIVGVGCKLFERPKLKYVFYSILVFTIYFIAIAFINAWFINYDASVNYFFLNGDTIVKRFVWAPNLKNNFVIIFNIKNLTLKIYWLYWLLTYTFYVGLIFVTWFLYVLLYKVSDEYEDLIRRKKMQVMDMLKLKREMQGRKITEPLHPEYGDMVKIEHFTKIYQGSKVKSVDNFSLEIKAGQVYGFLGHNGAGKSTTIKSMVGIQTLSKGSISISGFDISKQPLQAKMRIGYVSDNHAVYERLTGREYINYVADLYLVSKEDREERIEKYLSMFNLEEAIDREIKGYSHGMKQKLVVIASLIHNPKVWILDEPLTGLDPVSSFQIKEVMREHADNGNIVFFSSHVIEVVEKICDKICIISQGKYVGEWEIKELHQHGETLESLYMQYIFHHS
mgnify:CR=1 FL=1